MTTIQYLCIASATRLPPHGNVAYDVPVRVHGGNVPPNMSTRLVSSRPVPLDLTCLLNRNRARARPQPYLCCRKRRKLPSSSWVDDFLDRASALVVLFRVPSLKGDVVLYEYSTSTSVNTSPHCSIVT